MDNRSTAKKINELRQRREENGRLIEDILSFLNGAGSNRRIRPCDMDDPNELECPAGNLILDRGYNQNLS